MDSYYPNDSSGDDTSADTPSRSGDGGGEEQDPDEKLEGATALIPKTLLAGKDFKPGDEVVMKIVHDHGDEVEIAYATGEEKDDENENKGQPSPEMDGAMGKLDSMAA